ncbi:MAG: hypothetical protein WCA45_00400 [Thiobacillaceae bacterium]
MRVAIALGFERGRLKSVYQVLRGKDVDTGTYSPERREAQFDVLKDAQMQVLNLTYWHQFLSALIGAGFRSGEMISSQNALLYAYAFYLIGRIRCQVPEHQLQKAIGRWFFFSSLKGRYTSSPESTMDADLNLLREIKDAPGFLNKLDGILASEQTNDFWTISLPAKLDSSSARNPELFCYVAAQNRLAAPVLFSHKKIADLIDPALQMKKKALERHHLFPRAWLEKEGVQDLRVINQMANFALLEWPDNIDISDDPPSQYVLAIKSRFSDEQWAAMHEFHALPAGWETMAYGDFLVERRTLMAGIIRRGFETLILAKYQQDAYKNLIQIANRFGMAFLCDGVGLGKTFVGLMLLERMVVRDGKRVVLFAPKAAREDVWERAIRRYLPDLNSGFVNFIIYNHTDLQREGHWPRDIEFTLRDADVVLIDEAHHFRNPGIKGEGEKAPSL